MAKGIRNIHEPRKRTTRKAEVWANSSSPAASRLFGSEHHDEEGVVGGADADVDAHGYPRPGSVGTGH